MAQASRHEQDIEQDAATVARWIVAGRHVVAFTGAGISTDSGIPDFRGPDGVWTRRDAGLPAPRWRVAPGRWRLTHRTWRSSSSSGSASYGT